MYLVDANILSETTKAAPNARVLSWLEANEPRIRISALSIGEIHYGIELPGEWQEANRPPQVAGLSPREFR